MWAVFALTTTVAAPLQGALDAFFTGPVTSVTTSAFAAIGMSGSLVEGFVVDGLIAGVGMLLTFVPLMAIMFALLALLEDSGYMARAAVVTDRLMARLGLPGRAFLPLVVGFGCNVPAISAVRVLPDARHRLLTALLVPFTSCSARLTVYVMVAATFFPDHAGTVVFAMYVTSILLVVLGGLLLRSTLIRTVGSDPLVLDLPPYQRPSLRVLASATWMRLRGFLETASGIIVATVAVVWTLGVIPAPGTSGGLGEVPIADSLYAWLADQASVLFIPTGFAEWHAIGALMVGFVAKEAVISSWAQTYPADIDLSKGVYADFVASSGGHPQAAAVAFLVFLLAYTPCVATLAAQKRQIGSRWTAIGVATCRWRWRGCWPSPSSRSGRRWHDHAERGPRRGRHGRGVHRRGRPSDRSTTDAAETALAALSSTGQIHRVLVFADACSTEGCSGCGSSGGCASAGVGSLVGSGLTAWRVVAR